MSEFGEVDFQLEQNAATAGSNAGVDKLREEAYATKFDYCRVTGKNGQSFIPGVCTTPEGDLVIENPVLGRIVIQPDRSVVHIQPNRTYLLRDKDMHVTYLRYPNGKVRTFQYDDDGNLTGYVNPEGTVVKKVQDDQGLQRWTIEHKNGIVQMTDVTSMEVNEFGDLKMTLPSATYVFKADGRTIGASGNEGKETDAEGRLVKDIYERGSKEYQYGPEGCIDAIKTTSNYITVKDSDGWAVYSTIGNRIGIADLSPDDQYDKYSSFPPSCRIGENGEGIDISQTDDGKVVRIQDKDGPITLLNFDESDQLIRVEKTESKTHKRDNLVWRVYKGNGDGTSIETLSFRDMDFHGLDDGMTLVECLSQAQLKGF